MSDNTPSQLREILNDLLAEFGHPHEYMMRPVQQAAYNQAEQAILALFMECLPEKQLLINAISPEAGRQITIENQIIDITAQNMRALGSSDE